MKTQTYLVYHFMHSLKKQKDSLETRAVLLIFSLELEISGAYIKTANNDDICEELLSENDFEAVSATFCCYDHGAKVSQAVQKIATDQKEYRKCSSYVIICWIAKIYQSATNCEKWLVTRILPTWLKKLLSCTEKRAITGPW